VKSYNAGENYKENLPNFCYKNSVDVDSRMVLQLYMIFTDVSPYRTSKTTK
jgi:hypothetical protein